MSQALPDAAMIAAESANRPTPAQAEAGAAVLSNPLDFPAGFRGTIEDWITLMLPTPASLAAQIAAIAQPVGSYLIVPDDLTAQTGVYEYTHPSTGLKYLYANGAAPSQTTYAALYALWGANKWAADVGATFILPDTRGRSLWLAGTHTATDVGDTDGVAEASRQPKHEHTSAALTVTGLPGISGAPTAGTLAVTPNPHSHTIPTEDTATTAGGGRIFGSAANNGVTNTTSLSITGAPGIGTLAGTLNTLDVGGTGGSGMAGSDAVAHIVIGSLVIRF